MELGTIMIPDSEDNHNESRPEIYINGNPLLKIDYKPHKIESNNSPSVKNLSMSLKDLNVGTDIDEDVEVVEVLPPISLRNHPIIDVEDDFIN